MSNHDAATTAVQQVNAARRGFLGKLLTGGAAVAALPVMSTVVLGEQGQGIGKGKGGVGQAGKGKGRFGNGGEGRGKGRLDPVTMATRMIKVHDKDGDGALNVRELAAALKAMRERRPQQDGQGKGGVGAGRGKAGSGGRGKGVGRSS